MKPVAPGSSPFSTALAALVLLAGVPALAAQTASGSISSAAPANASAPAAARPDPATIPAAIPATATAANAAGLAAAAAATADGAAQAGALPVPAAGPAPAANPAAATPEQQAALAGARPAAPVDAAQAPSATGSLLTTIFSLVLVLGLLVGLAWLLKRYGPKTITGGANVKLVGALSVGARERILVVEVGEQWIVVGASPGRMNALATMPRQEDASGFAQAGALPGANFAEWFKQTMEKRHSGGSGNNGK